MSDKQKNSGKGKPTGKPAVSSNQQNTSGSSSAPRTPATSAAAQTRSSGRADADSAANQVQDSSSSGGWMTPVALLFGVVGTLLSAFLWSKLNTLSEATTAAFSSQKAETSTKLADTQTQITAMLDEKSAALGGNLQNLDERVTGQIATINSDMANVDSKVDASVSALQTQVDSSVSALETQVDADFRALNSKLDESTQSIEAKVSTDLTSLTESVRSSAQADKEEVSLATANTLQEFTTRSEGELNTISTSFNVGIRSLREDVESRFSDNESKVSMMQETLQTTNELANRGQRDWTLAEVEYLLRTGHHRVKLAGDVKAGVLALESANDRLHALGDIDYFPVREQIKKEVTELRRIGTPNIEGLIFRLETASKVADTLPLKQVEAADSAAEGAPQEAAEESQSGLGGLLKNMNFSVSTTNRNEVDKRLSSSDNKDVPNKEQISASEALSTHLQAARLSALRADSERFQLHMNNALSYTSDVFDTEDGSVQDFVVDLENIRETNIVPNVPILGSALSLFEKIDAKRSEK